MKGENIPQPGIPESFKVLIKELQSLSLDIKVLTEDEQEVEFRESDDDMYDYNQIDQNMDKDQMIVTDIDERSPSLLKKLTMKTKRTPLKRQLSNGKGDLFARTESI